jgi:hypothetical protein
MADAFGRITEFMERLDDPPLPGRCSLDRPRGRPLLARSAEWGQAQVVHRPLEDRGSSPQPRDLPQAPLKYGLGTGPRWKVAARVPGLIPSA